MVIADGAAVNAEAQRERGIVGTATKTQILRSTDAGLGAGLSDVVGQAGGVGDDKKGKGTAAVWS